MICMSAGTDSGFVKNRFIVFVAAAIASVFGANMRLSTCSSSAGLVGSGMVSLGDGDDADCGDDDDDVAQWPFALRSPRFDERDMML